MLNVDKYAESETVTARIIKDERRRSLRREVGDEEEETVSTFFHSSPAQHLCKNTLSARYDCGLNSTSSPRMAR